MSEMRVGSGTQYEVAATYGPTSKRVHIYIYPYDKPPVPMLMYGALCGQRMPIVWRCFAARFDRPIRDLYHADTRWIVEDDGKRLEFCRRCLCRAAEEAA